MQFWTMLTIHLVIIITKSPCDNVKQCIRKRCTRSTQKKWYNEKTMTNSQHKCAQARTNEYGGTKNPVRPLQRDSETKNCDNKKSFLFCVCVGFLFEVPSTKLSKLTTAAHTNRVK